MTLSEATEAALKIARSARLTILIVRHPGAKHFDVCLDGCQARSDIVVERVRP